MLFIKNLVYDGTGTFSTLKSIDLRTM